MNILCIGDIVGKNGIEIIQRELPKLKEKYKIDFVIANGENSCMGRGIKEAEYNKLISLGIDVVTMGNHLYYRKEAKEVYKNKPRILIPANVTDVEGKGSIVIECKGKKIGILNLIGKVHIWDNNERTKNPFEIIDNEIIRLKEDGAEYIFIDFHAEATAEKLALAYYVDGNVTCVFGTHTHVQTSDDRILPKGTAYITDLGMCGPKYSVLGLKKEIAISRFKNQSKDKYECSDEGYQFNSILVEIDEFNNNYVKICRVNI